LCKVQITTPIEFQVSLIPYDTHHIIVNETRNYEVPLPPKSFSQTSQKIDMMKQQTLGSITFKKEKYILANISELRYHKTCLDVLQNLMLAFHGSCHLVASVGK
jgi:hypothetical protein